jgi:hypothetical protein
MEVFLMGKKIIFIFVLILVTVFSKPLWADSTKELNAQKASDAWLSMVDEGKYSESWQNTSSYFKKVIDQNQWVKTLKAVRDPLGKLSSREVISRNYTKTLPGAPDGEYVVIHYQSSFENKASAIETVTPSLEKGGIWRVSGYYIK